MFFNSVISTVNELMPLYILSFPLILVNICLYGLYIKLEHGTNIPACAIIIFNPILFINVDLPLEFTPYKRIPLLDSLSISFILSGIFPKQTSFSIYICCVCILSTIGCLISFAIKNEHSFSTIDGLLYEYSNAFIAFVQ